MSYAWLCFQVIVMLSSLQENAKTDNYPHGALLFCKLVSGSWALRVCVGGWLSGSMRALKAVKTGLNHLAL